jgi:uncharacterized membrane protein SirB2
MHAPLRLLSHGVDTVLLSATLMLLTILSHALVANGWLATKLTLVVVYVVLGSLAIKRGRGPSVQMLCFALALIVYLTTIGIARAHHPLGWLQTAMGF